MSRIWSVRAGGSGLFSGPSLGMQRVDLLIGFSLASVGRVGLGSRHRGDCRVVGNPELASVKLAQDLISVLLLKH